MSLYYQDDFVTLYHDDCQSHMATMGEMTVKAVLTDPPYTDRTHAKARKKIGGGIENGVTDFGSINDADLEKVLTECGRISEGWVRPIYIAGTGHPRPCGKFIGTVVTPQGLVWHAFAGDPIFPAEVSS